MTENKDNLRPSSDAEQPGCAAGTDTAAANAASADVGAISDTVSDGAPTVVTASAAAADENASKAAGTSNVSDTSNISNISDTSDTSDAASCRFSLFSRARARSRVYGSSCRLLTGYEDRVAKKRSLYLLWAFLIPFVLLFCIYLSRAIYPFGNGSVLILDLNGQYVYFFAELRNKLLHGGSLLYSWSRSLGGEFLGIFAYYLSSPFSLITCLFPASHITEALLLMFMLKAGACGFSMALYLRSSHGGRKLGSIVFSTLYALCSYAIVMAHNTMWIDELIYLPLLALGIERLIKKKDFVLYVAILALAAMSNFYIGYMMCMFSFFYFFYYYFAKAETERITSPANAAIFSDHCCVCSSFR